MYIIPVAAAVADKPLEEIAEMLSDVRCAGDSSYVGGVGESAPVDDDDITVRYVKKSISNVVVKTNISVAVPTMHNYI